MPIARYATAVLFLGLTLSGCDRLGVVKGKADATQLFWAKLQGIQWHGNREITALNEAHVSMVRNYDIDGVASGFSRLSDKHSQLATRLMALDANRVDEIAYNYRDRLVVAHRELSQEYKSYAAVTESREENSMIQDREKLKSCMAKYVSLCNEKDSIMSQLQRIYHRDFDVAE